MAATPHHWQEDFEEGRLNRGRAYHDAGRVLQPFRTAPFPGPGNRGTVGGSWEVSGSLVYECTLTLHNPVIAGDQLRLTEVEVTCTCPSKVPCKHAAAILFGIEQDHAAQRSLQIPGSEAKHRPGPAGKKPERDDDDETGDETLPDLIEDDLAFLDQRQGLDHWLDLGIANAGAEDEPKDRVVYALGLLKPDRQYRGRHPDLTGIQVIKTRSNRQGGNGKGRAITHLDRWLHNPPGYVSDRDLSVAAILSGTRSIEKHGDFYAPGSSLTAILSLVADGDVYWGSEQGPALRRAPDRQPALRWESTDKSSETPKHRLRLDLGDAILLPVSGGLWADPVEGTWGACQGYDPQDIDLILRMPLVDNEDVPAVSATLKDRGIEVPESPVPPRLDPRRRERYRRVAIVVQRRLRGQTYDYTRYRPKKWSISAEVVIPAVRYPDGLVVATGNVSRSRDIRTQVTIVRDRRLERSMIRRLDEAGLATLGEFTKLRMDDEPGVEPDSVFFMPTKGLHKEWAEAPLHSLTLPKDLVTELYCEGWEIEGRESPDIPIIDLADAQVDLHSEGEHHDWFRLDLGVSIGEERIDLLPALRFLAKNSGNLDEMDDDEVVNLPTGDGRILKSPLAPLKRILEHIGELFDRAGSGTRVMVTAADLDLIDDLAAVGSKIGNVVALRKLKKDFSKLVEGDLPRIDPPPQFTATLRPYQQDGLNWLQAQFDLGLGALLADDMGLGKTVQTIAHLAVLKKDGKLPTGALVICPKSMMRVWEREIARFAPQLETYAHHGTGRTVAEIIKADVTLTTYATGTRDVALLKDCAFDIVVCDEAQVLKNPNAKASRAIRDLKVHHRLALTGTPMENHLGELWSLMSWLNPGLLGSKRHFDGYIRRAVEREGDTKVADRLRRRIAPVMLRRTKELVEGELPPKTEMILPVELGPKQRELYESIRVAMDDKVRDAIAAQGLAKSGMLVLEALLRLRQACCDPSLIGTDRAHGVKESAKLEELAELLPTMVEDDRRILIFSQFTAMLDRIGGLLNKLELSYEKLTGQTQNRQALIDGFQNGDFPIFLISLKAGGTGLTLTAADTVIHVDPWWNPAAEDQATDRAHRIGQDKPVFVYRLVAVGTVEERIRTLQEQKRTLAASLYDGTGGSTARFTSEEVEELLKPLGT